MRCASAEMAVARLGARQDLREAQVHAAKFGLRLAIQLRGFRRAAGLVGDQRGVQRIDPAELLAIDERTQRGQRRVGATVALLRPGDQQRLQELRQALARQHTEALLRRLPVAGAHLGLAQQKLRRLAVRQLAGKLHRLGAAGDQAGDERLLQQFRIIRLRGERAQELRGGRLRSPPRSWRIGRSGTRRTRRMARRDRTRGGHPARGGIGCRAG